MLFLRLLGVAGKLPLRTLRILRKDRHQEALLIDRNGFNLEKKYRASS